MTDEDLFHQETLPAGGRWVVPPGNPELEGGYQYIAETARELILSARSFLPSLPPIHFDFVHNGKVNAWSFKSEGRYFIGVTTGTLYTLRLVFYRMLADGMLFMEKGNVAKEILNPPPLVGFVPDAQRLCEAGMEPIPPRDESRRLYADYLFEYAFNFLVGHEIAHISLGHIDYVASKGQLSMLAEKDLPEKAELLERQCLESQADCRSAFSRIHSIKLTLESQPHRIPPWGQKPVTLKNAIADWLFALHALFFVFDGELIVSPDAYKKDHPPAIIRRVFSAVETLKGGALESNLTLKERVKDTLTAVSNVLPTSTAMMARILGQRVPHKVWLPIGDIVRYQERLAQHERGALKAKLAPFSYE